MASKLGYNTGIFEGAKALIESPHVGMDLMMCSLGTRLSNGCFRDVYAHTLNSELVLKIEYGHDRKDEYDTGVNNSFCNVQEFLLWQGIQYLKGPLEWVKQWFAPIEWISPGGHILCMQRTYEMPEKERPEMIPDFLWDVKKENFGWIGDQFVCHDYAHVHAFASYSKKMRKVKHLWY